jgi:hypothetical protein
MSSDEIEGELILGAGSIFWDWQDVNKKQIGTKINNLEKKEELVFTENLPK